MRIDRECGTKQGYLSKAEAKRVARMMTEWHGEALHLYTCSHCRLFHVGHVAPAWQRQPAWA